MKNKTPHPNIKELPIELDYRPIYLGYDNTHQKYWFYSLKGGQARFLAYVSYFFWDRGPQTILELKPIPKEIEVELGLFLEQKVTYEFKKKRSNSKTDSVVKTYRVPSEVGASGSEVRSYSETGKLEPGGSESGVTTNEPGTGNSDPGCGVRKRRNRVSLAGEKSTLCLPVHEKPHEHGPVGVIEVTTGETVLAPKKRGRPKGVKAPVIAEVVVSEPTKRRGRPKKLLEPSTEALPNDSETIPKQRKKRLPKHL